MKRKLDVGFQQSVFGHSQSLSALVCCSSKQSTQMKTQMLLTSFTDIVQQYAPLLWIKCDSPSEEDGLSLAQTISSIHCSYYQLDHDPMGFVQPFCIHYMLNKCEPNSLITPNFPTSITVEFHGKALLTMKYKFNSLKFLWFCFFYK